MSKTTKEWRDSHRGDVEGGKHDDSLPCEWGAALNKREHLDLLDDADALSASEARVKELEGKLESMRITQAHGRGGWTLDPDILKRINDEASKSGWYSSMESVEAVMLAMADEGLALLDRSGQ